MLLKGRKAMTITYQDYWKEVAALAADVSLTAKEDQENLHDRLMETIDGHQWVIYYHYNLPVLQHCSDAEAVLGEMGSGYLEEVLRDSGLSGLHSTLAFWAMLKDVQEHENYVDWEE